MDDFEMVLVGDLKVIDVRGIYDVKEFVYVVISDYWNDKNAWDTPTLVTRIKLTC